MATCVWRWVYAAAAVTLVLGVTYVVMQQQYRASLNDPQVALAEDAALAIEHGAGIENALVAGGRPLQVSTSTSGHVDLAESLSPWVAYYDAAGSPLDATGLLAGQLPRLPAGVFDSSSWVKHANGTFYDQGPLLETRLTWQPMPGVRQAVVLVKLSDASRGVAYVASGRSMREGEQRIEHLGELIFLGWLATLVILAVLQWLYVLGTGAARRRAR